MELLLASGNHHKQREIAEILPSHRILVPADLGIEFEYEETGATYLDNCLGKGFALFHRAGRPVIADDSGISVPALGGAPGVYSARYGAERGLALDDAGRYRLLLEDLLDAADRSAFYVCCMVIILEEYRYFVCQETLHGEIAREPVGSGGFGYDPVFYLPDRGRTVAQISAAEKHVISHRGRAGRRVGEILQALQREESANR